MSKTPPRKPLHEWFLESYPEEKITPDTHIKNPMFQQWIPIEQELPKLGQIVLLHELDENYVGIGGRCEVRSTVKNGEWEDVIQWGNAHEAFWHNGKEWDGDINPNDIYQPTHWFPLPELPVKEEA